MLQGCQEDQLSRLGWDRHRFGLGFCRSSAAPTEMPGYGCSQGISGAQACRERASDASVASRHRRHDVPRHDSPRSTFERIDAGVRRGVIQPGTWQGTALEAGTAPPGAGQRPLEQVLGVVERAQHAIAVDLELVSVALHERRERCLVPGAEHVHDHVFSHAWLATS